MWAPQVSQMSVGSLRNLETLSTVMMISVARSLTTLTIEGCLGIEKV